MSSQRVISRIKEHLGRNADPNRRKVFGRGVKQIPWYSLHRLRNVVIVSILMSAGMMSKPIYDVYWGIVRSIRMEKERSKFIMQLDEEEKEGREQSGSTEARQSI